MPIPSSSNRPTDLPMNHSGIRIAYLANFRPNKLGTGEDRLVALARGARSRGHSFTLFCHQPLHPSVEAALAEVGAEVEDLVPLGVRPWVEGRRLAKDFDVVQLNLIAPRSRIALATYLSWPAAVLFLDHVSGPPDGVDSGSSTLGKLLDPVTMVRVKQIAGVSNYIRDRTRQRFGLPENRTQTVYGGVDHLRFRPQLTGRPSQGPLQLTVVSALIPEKGIHVLLEAVSQLASQDWNLNVVGTGREEANLKAQCEAMGISSKVAFLGLRDDVDQLLRASDILVHPAIWMEALGYTVLEGMATGCAVVASRVGGIPEIIDHESHGLLVEAGNVGELRSALEILAGDPKLRASLGTAARARIEEHFTLEKSVDTLLDWFEWAAPSRGTKSSPSPRAPRKPIRGGSRGD